MIKTNYHTHNRLCDGSGPVSDYLEAAAAKGFTALGFSSHAPLPLETSWHLSNENLAVYLDELRSAREKWRNRVQVYIGLEVDFVSGLQAPGDARWKNLGLDYVIGSVHTTTGAGENPEFLCIDGSLDEVQALCIGFHNGSWKSMSESYYLRIAEMVSGGGFSFIGHFDLIKKRNAKQEFFSEDASWYRNQVKGALNAVADSGIIMEVNTGGIARRVIDQVYPSPWILSEARKLGIPVMLNSDAHNPEDLDCHFEESRALLRDEGYREIWALIDGDWTAVPL